MKEKAIIIGGGVGPQAGVVLHNYIIENTLTDGTDQDHLDVYHISRSSDIFDRTQALFYGRPELPAEGMLRTFKIADTALKTAKKTGVGGVPCNTFHAPAIFDRFKKLVTEEGLSIYPVNMIDETILFIREQYPEVHTIGLMSTTGTRNSRVYNNILEPIGFTIVQIPEKDQTILHNAIYNKVWGIKALPKVDKRVRERLKNYALNLKEQGAGIIILGCTEIPLALPEKELSGIPLLDPMFVLARSLIREANPNKLKEL